MLRHFYMHILSTLMLCFLVLETGKFKGTCLGNFEGGDSI